ncbi:MAG: hypothetical protein PVI92_16020 [Chromatiales bacterium]|jgi:hypothetical protein
MKSTTQLTPACLIYTTFVKCAPAMSPKSQTDPDLRANPVMHDEHRDADSHSRNPERARKGGRE